MFSGVKYRLCILIGKKSKSDTASQATYVTNYMRWYAEQRPQLFEQFSYLKCTSKSGFLRFAKIGNQALCSVIDKIQFNEGTLGENILSGGAGHIVYHRSPVFWIRSMNFEPYFKSEAGKERSTDHLKDLYFSSYSLSKRAGAILNSSLFYLWFTVQGNCRNIAENDIKKFPVGDITSGRLEPTESHFDLLIADLQRNAKRRIYNYKHSGRVEYDEFYPSLSKLCIDPIDRVLATHYAFTDEELDYIINYDIKYRMGLTSGKADPND